MKFDEQDIRLGIMRGIVRYMEEGSYQEPAAELQAIATTLARKAVSMIPHQWEARGIRLLTEMVSLGVFCRAHHAQIEQLSPHEVVGVSDGFSKLVDSWCGWGLLKRGKLRHRSAWGE